MRLEDTKDEIYKKKKKSSQVRDLNQRSFLPQRSTYNRTDTAKLVERNTKQGIWRDANILNEEKQISYYYMISTSNYEKLAISWIFLLGLHVFNVSVITASDMYVVGRDIRKAIHKHGVRSVDWCVAITVCLLMVIKYIRLTLVHLNCKFNACKNLQSLCNG